jgi:hypothetical protein
MEENHEYYEALEGNPGNEDSVDRAKGSADK